MQEKAKEKYKLELKTPLPEPDKNIRKICCAACSREIPGIDININDKIAKCNECNIVFSIQGEVSGLLEKKKIRQEIIRPEGIDLFHFGDELDITFRQPWTALEIIAVCCLPFFAILFTIVFFEKDISVFIPGILWLSSLAVIANAYLRPKHKVHITIDDRYLSVYWRPKKLHKDKDYRLEEIDQVYVRLSPDGTGYSVNMITNGVNGQKHVALINGLQSISKAHFLEQEIERHLGIVDRVVSEES